MGDLKLFRQHKIYAALMCCGLLFIKQTPAQQKTDSAEIHHRDSINVVFDNIYRQNIRPSFFGNEYGNPLRNLLVADIAPAFIFFQSKRSRFFFVVSPRVRLRLLSEFKSPVKSPSYMPNGAVFFRVNNDYTHPRFISVVYSHHSNGQEGPTTNPDGTFNRNNGKFTTNFYQLNYHFGRNFQSAAKAIGQYAFIGVEIHSGLVHKGYSKELDGKYGFIRANGGFIYDILRDKTGTGDRYSNHQRLQVDLAYILDREFNYAFTRISKRLNIELKYYYQFGFMPNTALMLGAGYRGQDPYNIYFRDNYPFITIGFAAGAAFNLHKKPHYDAL